MVGALLEAHGRRTGVYLSPHTERWSERVRIGGAEIDAGEFAAAAERVAQSVEVVNRALEEGESVTQFEAATATAFVALASAGVEFGVIEAGLGGRLDATNVLPSRATALTSVGLEHTEWLGETEEEIAAEKLAVLRDHSALVLGRVGDGVRELAERVAAERSARLILAGDADPKFRLAVPGAYQRRNFAVATGAAEAIIGEARRRPGGGRGRGARAAGSRRAADGRPAADPGRGPQPGRRPCARRGTARGDRRGAGRRLSCDPGRQGRGGRPRGAGAPARRTRSAPSSRPSAWREPVVPAPARWRQRDSRSSPRRPGSARTEVVGRPEAALRRAVAAARERGGVTLVTGSHYLLGYAAGARLGQLGQDTEASDEREVK